MQFGQSLPADVMQLIPADALERYIAQATELRDRWKGYLAEFRQNGAYKLRIDGEWETTEQADARLQGIVDNYSLAVELLEGSRAMLPDES